MTGKFQLQQIYICASFSNLYCKINLIRYYLIEWDFWTGNCFHNICISFAHKTLVCLFVCHLQISNLQIILHENRANSVGEILDTMYDFFDAWICFQLNMIFYPFCCYNIFIHIVVYRFDLNRVKMLSTFKLDQFHIASRSNAS